MRKWWCSIITLTKRPDNIELCFVNPVIALKPRVTPELVLYSNVPLSKPRLLIDGDFYDGEFVADKKHARLKFRRLRGKAITLRRFMMARKYVGKAGV